MTDRLVFVPLGGVGEIGMTVYPYGLADSWLMVDLGISFADERLPGADIVLPDIQFAEELGDKLKALVLTHAHEDHLGAVPYLWRRLRVPVWCSNFTAAVLRLKLAESGLAGEVPVRRVAPRERFEIGPFGCRFLHVTHSIPESGALALETRFGRVLHTGDWKLDPEPMVGERSDVEELEQLGRSGVLAIVCDSTNALSPGTSGSEAEVRESLTELIKGQPNRVVLTTFASNIARMETAMLAAHAAGRELFVVGRSMRRMIEAAREVGFLKAVPPIRDEREADSLPRNRVLYLCTGSQGEARSAPARVAAGPHPRVRLSPRDAVIFSSKRTPGRGPTRYSRPNRPGRRGVEATAELDHLVPRRVARDVDEVEQMY